VLFRSRAHLSIPVCLTAGAVSLAHVDTTRLSPDERRVLATVDGARTVREIVEHTRMASFDACKILFQLTTSRLVRVTASPDPL
jgi:hypothetical protein